MTSARSVAFVLWIGAASTMAFTSASVLTFSMVDKFACAILAGTMASIVLSDVHYLRVPDRLVALTALAGLGWSWVSAGGTGASLVEQLSPRGLDMAVCGGSFLLLRETYYRLRGTDGLGLGDVKLAAAAGAWVAADLFAMAVLLASLAALAFVMLTILRVGAWSEERRIPYAAYLAPSLWIVWFTSRL